MVVVDDTLVIVAGKPLNVILTVCEITPDPSGAKKFKELGVKSNCPETAVGAISIHVANAVASVRMGLGDNPIVSGQIASLASYAATG